MTKWLASVQSLQEAQTLAPQFPDILDIKQPSQGALGALPVAEVSEIVKWVDKRCQVSATVGDLIMDANIIGPAIVEMAATGVDFVKAGIFPDGDLHHCLTELLPYINSLSTPVIAVLFADKPLALGTQQLLLKSGFKGVMVDTAVKDGQHLRDHMNDDSLLAFVAAAKNEGLLCGLAGALRREDIVPLKQFGADYLGFRSALCKQRNRRGELDIERVRLVKQAIESN